MKFRTLLLASAVSVSWAAPAFATDPSIAADAKAFGTRASAQSVDISPSGSKLVMIDPGAGKSSIVSIVDVASGAVTPIL